MIVIYACFSGTHAAIIAGAIHLGWLTSKQVPTWQRLMLLPHFDTPEGKGGLRYLGRLPAGLAVYTAAVGHDSETARRAVQTFLAALGWEQQEVLWVDVSRRVSLLWRLGAFWRRYPWLAFPGQLLLQWSLKRNYPALVALVWETCRELAGIEQATAPRFPASSLGPRQKLDGRGKILDN